MRTRALLALGAVVLTALIAASPALATPHAYTPQNPTHDETLPKGFLGTQVDYSNGPNFLWSYELNAATYGAATGPMTEDADIYCNGKRISGYHDHHVVPASYLIHSHYKPVNTGCDYQLAVNEVFPIRGGTRYVYLRYDFVITYV